ncbi:unnamed protein product [Durusdinium trenchii]|uniref:tRNA (guanine(9)-N(1))-methyltransferase n=1 Tax=Durusdinium trenchii TaxID=1381693 RepID=A0ABP0NHT4_9DINO
MEGQEGTATEEAPEQGAGEATDQGEADREDNGEEGALERPSRKALKRKAKAEKCLEWKAQQKAKRKRGGQRHKGPPLPPNGESGRPEGEGPTQRLGAEEVKAQRLLRKAKELEDFRERSGRGTTVVLDLEWEEQMQPKELKSLIQQVLYCYGANRKSSHPTRLVFSGVKEGSKTYEGLSKQSGYESWEVQKLSGPYIEAFPKEKLIYLTADAPEVLDTFDPEKVYVIGPLILKVLLVPGGMIDIPKKIHPQTAQTCPNLLNKPFTWARDRQAR